MKRYIKSSLDYDFKLDDSSKDYLSSYMELTPDVIHAIERHARKYNIPAVIYAYYKDFSDFVDYNMSTYKSIGIDRDGVVDMYESNPRGEFLTLPSGEILEFAIDLDFDGV